MGRFCTNNCKKYNYSSLFDEMFVEKTAVIIEQISKIKCHERGRNRASCHWRCPNSQKICFCLLGLNLFN